MVTALTGVLTASQRYMRDQTVKIVLLLCLCASPFPFCMNLTEKLDFFNSTASLRILLCILLIVHFTVTGGNEAGVDLNLTLALLCKCVLMQTSIFKHTFHEKRREVCITTRSVSSSLSLKGKDTKLTTVKWYSVLHATSPTAPNFISHITCDLSLFYYFMPFPSTPVRTLKKFLSCNTQFCRMSVAL